MGWRIDPLKVKFFLGSTTLVVGFIGATIALFQWVERTGVQHLFGDYSRYVLGFGGFAAMIFGAMVINDAWVLRNILRNLSKTTDTMYEEVRSSGKGYKKRVIRNILRGYGLKEDEED